MISGETKTKAKVQDFFSVIGINQDTYKPDVPENEDNIRLTPDHSTENSSTLQEIPHIQFEPQTDRLQDDKAILRKKFQIRKPKAFDIPDFNMHQNGLNTSGQQKNITNKVTLKPNLIRSRSSSDSDSHSPKNHFGAAEPQIWQNSNQIEKKCIEEKIFISPREVGSCVINNNNPSLISSKKNHHSATELKVQRTDKTHVEKRKHRFSQIIRSSSQPIKISENNSLNNVQNRLISIAEILKNLGEEQSIAVGGKNKEIFYTKNIQKTSEADRKKYVKEILKCIATGANFGLTDLKLGHEVVFLQQMVDDLQKKNWFSGILNTNQKSRITLEIATKALEDAYSAKIVEKLFIKQIEILNHGISERLLLKDLCLVYPKLTNLNELLIKVGDVLLDTLLSSLEKRLLGSFCIDCFQNLVGLNFYPHENISSTLEKLYLFLPKPLNTQLAEAYKQACFDKSKFNINDDIKIAPLNFMEEEKEHALRILVESGKWVESTVTFAAQSLFNKLRSELCRVPLDELLSDKIKNAESCPKFHSLATTVNNLISRAALDILQASTIESRQNVIKFYIELIYECLAQGNFAAAFALYNALSMHPVSRLKKTWDGLQHKMEDLNTLFNPNNYYHAMQTKIKEFVEKNKADNYVIQPFFFFSSFLDKFDEIPTYDENNCIDQNKFILIARKVILPFQKMQRQVPYRTETDGFFARRMETVRLSKISDKVLEQLSEKWEPTQK